MPPVILGGASGDSAIYQTLNNYLNNREVFWCPSDSIDRKWPGGLMVISSQSASYGFNYAGTGNMPGLGTSGCFSFRNDQTPFFMKKAANVVSPSTCIAAADSYHDNLSELSLYYPNGLQNGNPAEIHNGGSNILFVDGHMKWYKVEDLISARNDIYQMWNYDNTINNY